MRSVRDPLGVLGYKRVNYKRGPGIKRFRCGIPMVMVSIGVYLTVITRASTGVADQAEEVRKVIVDKAEKILLLNDDLNIERQRVEEL